MPRGPGIQSEAKSKCAYRNIYIFTVSHWGCVEIDTKETRSLRNAYFLIVQ